MAKVEHFEIPADDLDRAKRFYGNVFGFTFEDWDDKNTMVSTGEGGIGGDIHLRSVVMHPTFVITVDDLEGSLVDIIAAGGKQIGQIEDLDENSRYAYFEDSEGNTLGIYARTDAESL